MRPFEYVSPTTVDEALALLGQDGDSAPRPLAGGTDLLTLMKADIAAPSRLVNLKRLSEVPSGIKETDQGVTLGALTPLVDLETNLMIQQRYPVLAEAAAVAATPQLRNTATLGGNLLQRPRCWYFRNAHWHCWLKGGEACPAYEGENQLHALFGGGPCYAVHPSDIAPALLALDATVLLRGRDGERTLPLAEFFAVPVAERRTETVVLSDEILLAVHIPSLPDGTRSTYLKAMDRKVWAFALVGVAAVLRLGAEDGPSGPAPTQSRQQRIEAARLVLSGVAPIPWRVMAAEQVLIGTRVSEALFARAAEVALAAAEPLSQNAYKVPLARALIRRGLAALTAGATAGAQARQ
jgi:xanthine dehydrogenase YagS FAD-binding subunit